MIFNYEKKGEIHTVGECGRLNCLKSFWVLPGDVISLNYAGLFRMPNMRKYIWTPVDFKIFAFFTPAAWVYPNFRKGLKTHLKDPLKPIIINSTDNPFYYDGQFTITNDDEYYFHWYSGNPIGTSILGSSMVPYHMVWNEYFRDLNYHTALPTDISSSSWDTNQANFLNSMSESQRDYGLPVCNLPNVLSNINAKSQEVDNYYEHDFTGSSIDMAQLAKDAQSIKSTQEYYNVAQRYRDLISKHYGGSVSHEADPRPYLLGIKDMTFGGHDVDATGDNIGETQGKSNGKVSFQMNDVFFGEHGFLQLYAVPRFNPIYEKADEPFWHDINTNPAEVLCSPDFVSQTEPQFTHFNSFFYDTTFGGSSSAWKFPASEQQRWGVSLAHRRFFDVEAGFPLMKQPDTIQQALECQPQDWQRMFISKTLGQYSLQSMYHMDYKSVLPPSNSSLFAGSR